MTRRNVGVVLALTIVLVIVGNMAATVALACGLVALGSAWQDDDSHA